MQELVGPSKEEEVETSVKVSTIKIEEKKDVIGTV